MLSDVQNPCKKVINERDPQGFFLKWERKYPWEILRLS